MTAVAFHLPDALHHLPMLRGRPLAFTTEQIRTFYADKDIALEREKGAFCYLPGTEVSVRTG